MRWWAAVAVVAPSVPGAITFPVSLPRASSSAVPATAPVIGAVATVILCVRWWVGRWTTVSGRNGVGDEGRECFGT